MAHVTVHFEIDAPMTNRHRVSVWNDEGGVLVPSSAAIPDDLLVEDGDTIWVEASVPGSATRANRANRDERRWELRASSDAHAVLEIGRKGKNGATGTRMQIRVDGAAPPRVRRGPQAHRTQREVSDAANV